MAPLDESLISALDDAGGGDEEAHYEAYRTQLLEELRGVASSRYRLEPREHGSVGLMNQGATCYMNSLLQALFYTLEFRRLVYEWRYDPSVHGDVSRSIPWQLQRLFAQLQLSQACAVSTKALTGAFGFSDMESREQHDVQELCRVLFDALARSALTLKTGIDRLYSGKLTNYVRSREAAEDGSFPESRREEQFLDLQVPIQDCKTLEEGLQKLVDTEILEGGNQWFCEELGRKVDALKGTDFGELPPILCLQLLRFVFDFTTMRRRKLAEALSIPLVLNIGSVWQVPNEAVSRYELTAVCLHSGTAHGGHYHAFIRQGGCRDSTSRQWHDANDSNVRPFSEQQESGLFVPRATEGGLVDEEVRALASSDAYFLMYCRVDSEACPVQDESVPEPHRSEVLEDNTRLEALQRAYKVHKQLREIRVYAPTAVQLSLRRNVGNQLRGLLGEEESEVLGNIREPQNVILNVYESKSVSEVRRRAIDAFLAEAEKGGEPWPWAMRLCTDDEGSLGSRGVAKTRLRVFNSTTGETNSLLEEEARVGDAVPRAQSVIVEAHGPDETCKENADDARHCRVNVCRWDSEHGCIGIGHRDVVALRLPLATQEPGAEDLAAEVDRTPTIGVVRSAVVAAFGLKDTSTLALVCMVGSKSGQVLEDDAETLLQAAGDPNSGIILCAEVIAIGSRPCCADLYERVKNTVSLSFNHPDRPEYTEELEVSISKDASVHELKVKIAALIGLEADTFHIARSRKLPQLKDETKSLRSVGLSESGSCFVGHGAPCAADEFMLKVLFYSTTVVGNASRCRDIFSHPVKATASIRSVREALVKPLLQWRNDTMPTEGEEPFSVEGLQWRRLRLRDGQAGKQFAILRDDRTVRSALLGLADGRQLAVQVLDEDEELTAEDWIFQLRPWRYAEGKLHSATEWITGKGQTLAMVREELTQRYQGILVDSSCSAKSCSEAVAAEASGTEAATSFPERGESEDRLEVVALPSAGPPLTVKRCASLPWATSLLNSTDAEHLQRSISEFEGVRDGVTLVLRSAVASASGPPGEPPGKGAGKGGVVAPKAKAKGTAAKAAGGPKPIVCNGAPRRERGLVIEVAHPQDDVGHTKKAENEASPAVIS